MNTNEITLRDYFAAQALNTLLQCSPVDGTASGSIDNIVKYSYVIADKMIDAKEVRQDDE
ncbi:hypothetical protein ACSMDF_15265 [Yersinia enterocolitica]